MVFPDLEFSFQIPGPVLIQYTVAYNGAGLCMKQLGRQTGGQSNHY